MAEAHKELDRDRATAAAQAKNPAVYKARPMRNIDMKALRRSVMARTARIRAYLASN